MRKFILASTTILLISLSTFAAELIIPEDKRIKNLPSGCCVWASLECLGKVHGITELNGITQYRHDNYSAKKIQIQNSLTQDQFGNWTTINNPQWLTVNEAPGTENRVHEEMKRLKINYKLQSTNNFDLTLVKDAIDKSLGAAVGFKHFPKVGDYHMVTLTELTDDKIIFIDNRDKQKYGGTRQWFNEHWMGFTVVVYPTKIKESRENSQIKEERSKD